MLLIHWPDDNTPFDETMHALDSLVHQGKVRAVGVSNFTLDQIKECESVRGVDVVQYGLNMFDRRMEQEIFPYCQAQGTGVMVYGPLAFWSPIRRFQRWTLHSEKMTGVPRAGGQVGTWGCLQRSTFSETCRLWRS